jgi:hypothetical protein
MAKFLTTHSTASEIDNIIRNAQEWLVIISPFIQLTPIFLERLRDAGVNNVKITIVYGKTELKPEVLQGLSTIQNMSLYYCDNLHAKCYCNRDHAVVTSMNLLGYSEKNNREMGILLHRDSEAEVYGEIYTEIKSIINASIPIPLTQNRVPVSTQTYSYPQPQQSTRGQEKSVLRGLGGLIGGAINNLFSQGYCIRCHERIELDPEHPLCRECYREWNRYKNPEFVDEYCHNCGKRTKTTKAKPLCKSCYSKS